MVVVYWPMECDHQISWLIPYFQINKLNLSSSFPFETNNSKLAGYVLDQIAEDLNQLCNIPHPKRQVCNQSKLEILNQIDDWDYDSWFRCWFWWWFDLKKSSVSARSAVKYWFIAHSSIQTNWIWYSHSVPGVYGRPPHSIDPGWK